MRIRSSVVWLAAILVVLLALPAGASGAPSQREIATESVTKSFPWIWELGYERRLPFGVTTADVQPHELSMVTSVNGVPKLVTAKGLFGFHDSKRNVRMIDTRLRSQAGGWSPASTAFGVHLPARYSAGVTWTTRAHGRVTLTPIGSNRAAPSGDVIGADRDQVLWPLAWPATDVVGTVMGNGIREHLVARDERAPRVFAWAIRLQDPKASLFTRDGSIYHRNASGAATLLSRPAYAVDAAGQTRGAFRSGPAQASTR